MRAGTVWMLTAVLALTVGAGQAAAQQADSKDNPGWLARLFGKKAEPAKPAPAKTPAKEEPRPPTAAEMAAAVQARERLLLDRRQSVCDKLKDIALRSGDEALLRRAEQLDERAWALYQQRTGTASAAPASFQSDEQTLTRHLGGSGGTADAPTPPNLTLRAVEDSSGRTAARREP